MFPLAPTPDFMTAVVIEGKHPETESELALGAYVFVQITEWYSESDHILLFFSSQNTEDVANLSAVRAHRSQVQLIAGGPSLDMEMPRHLVEKSTISDVLRYYFPTQSCSGLEKALLQKFEITIRQKLL